MRKEISLQDVEPFILNMDYADLLEELRVYDAVCQETKDAGTKKFAEIKI